MINIIKEEIDELEDKVDKHNYRKYDNEQDLIEIVKGTSSPFDDVKNLY